MYPVIQEEKLMINLKYGVNFWFATLIILVTLCLKLLFACNKTLVKYYPQELLFQGCYWMW